MFSITTEFHSLTMQLPPSHMPANTANLHIGTQGGNTDYNSTAATQYIYPLFKASFLLLLHCYLT
jgi:hypothetical protein